MNVSCPSKFFMLNSSASNLSLTWISFNPTESNVLHIFNWHVVFLWFFLFSFFHSIIQRSIHPPAYFMSSGVLDIFSLFEAQFFCKQIFFNISLSHKFSFWLAWFFYWMFHCNWFLTAKLMQCLFFDSFHSFLFWNIQTYFCSKHSKIEFV